MTDSLIEFLGAISSGGSNPHAVPTYFPARYSDVSTTQTLKLGRVDSWVRSTVDQLAALGSLETGWDSYGGKSLTPEARIRIIEIIRSLQDVCNMENATMPVPNVVLNSAGTVGLEWDDPSRELGIGIGEGDQVEYVKWTPPNTIKEGKADRDSASLIPLVHWFLTGRMADHRPNSATTNATT